MVNQKIKVLYVVNANVTTSIPLEVAGKIQEMNRTDIEFQAMSFYPPRNKPKGNFVKNLTELNIQSLLSPKDLAKFSSVIKSYKPDVIHLHHSASALLGSFLAKLNGVKLIVKTEHNDHKHYKWYQKVLNIPIMAMSDILICNSESTEASFYPWEKLLSKGKSIPIYNGINIEQITQYDSVENTKAMRAKYGIQPNERLFVTAARLTKQKNYDNLIKGFAAAAKKNPNIKLLIAGGGELEGKLSKLKDEVDTNNNIQLLGMVTRDEVYQLVNAADIFIVVSLWEGFCNAAVEAMVAKCPMICSDIITLKEVVGEEVGRFVQPLSVPSISEGVLEFANMSDEELNDLAIKSEERAKSRYAIEKTAKRYVDQYLKVKI